MAFGSSKAGVPGSELMPDDLRVEADVMIIETECTINPTCLNHPKPSQAPWFVEELSSIKPVSVTK